MQPKATAVATQKAEPITQETVAASANEAEFESKKEELIKQLADDIKGWEDERDSVKRETEEAKVMLTELDEKKVELKTELEVLQTQVEDAHRALDDAEAARGRVEEEASAIRSEADSYAEETRRAVDEERVAELAKVAGESRAAWQAQIDDLEKQFEELAVREKELASERRKLDRDKSRLEDDQEALSELRGLLVARKKRYDEASPAAVVALQLELDDERAKYEALVKGHEELSKRYADLQALVDSMRAEVADSDGASKTIAIGQLVDSFRSLRERYEKLSSVYGSYPDDEAIAALEEKARRAEALERENDALLDERNRYRDELAVVENERRELQTIRRSTAATYALNDHLLRELESHKAALESRTEDTCVSLTQVDVETESPEFVADVNHRVNHPGFKTLRDIVQHVKNYAGSRPEAERLYYTENDIRAFLAGMSVSRLVILQGMSGTGKSSLPRIFAEAISGFNKMIPVESSWRDRNELLGYYNDFSKKFNAKTFTVELYRSGKGHCRKIPTFIVLDEMNLARIEYYFTDFLSILQEPDHVKWLVELVSSDMRTLPTELPEKVREAMRRSDPSIYEIWESIEKSRSGDPDARVSDKDRDLLFAHLDKADQLIGARDLVDGRKIRVTDNVWFIGTVNRDESTFEISDKVYDRAQVVSLNRRGVPEGSYGSSSSSPRFISASSLQKLFDEAVRDNDVHAEVEERLGALDSLLIEKFDTSFGNRIVTQTNRFSSVFIAAGGSLVDALDYQISTKIIRKVITSDDEEALLDLSEGLEDYSEAARLVEKRLRELRN